MPLRAMTTIPVLRIFDESKAREFYVDYLGFQVDWEHRYEPGMPLYMQVSLDGLVLHLSEHHGDGTPGSTVFVRVEGLERYHEEIRSKGYGYLRPGLETTERESRCLELIDPFGNRLRLDEKAAA